MLKSNKLRFILFGLVMAVYLSGCGPSADGNVNRAEDDLTPFETTELPSQGTATSPTPYDVRLFNLEKYDQVKPGQSYEEVQALMGDPGEIMVDHERLKQFQWNNGDGSMISVTFFDNEMTGKGQAHLGPLLEGGQRVTKKQFDQLAEGMSMADVVNLLGPGTERVFTLIDEEVEQIIGWENNDGSEISVTVNEGIVIKVSSLMLK